MSLLVLVACSPTPTVTVLAASSLTEVFAQLEQAFEGQHDLDVRVSVAGSQTLATQLRAGLEAQAFASADRRHLDELALEGRVGEPRVLARGRLVLVVPESSSLRELEDLTRAERLVLGTPQVPVGAYAEQVLEDAGLLYGSAWLAEVRARVVSRELSVRQVRSKVLLGEADAAFLYATDMNDLHGIRTIELPESLAPTVLYHQAEVLPVSAEGRAWMDFTSGAEALEIVHQAGFSAP